MSRWDRPLTDGQLADVTSATALVVLLTAAAIVLVAGLHVLLHHV